MITPASDAQAIVRDKRHYTANEERRGRRLITSRGQRGRRSPSLSSSPTTQARVTFTGNAGLGKDRGLTRCHWLSLRSSPSDSGKTGKLSPLSAPVFRSSSIIGSGHRTDEGSDMESVTGAEVVRHTGSGQVKYLVRSTILYNLVPSVGFLRILGCTPYRSDCTVPERPARSVKPDGGFLLITRITPYHHHHHHHHPLLIKTHTLASALRPSSAFSSPPPPPPPPHPFFFPSPPCQSLLHPPASLSLLQTALAPVLDPFSSYIYA
ncbi:hypothetical protein BO71DRAFT_233347 [Aspergillus ellipticus CBS 707.79]|uniref:Uncharacterized protein n=1 Tax=Aspergillus ellipticus CBS 707.79 TaxID=1448320 RepID=A0A319DNQ5_9EURO|nr:hypothetical protein BO71DRAFT_233347 [Aspergillus ellipticus CBS 707.79]